MRWCFRRSISIGKSFRINLSKSGMGVIQETSQL
ncbi:DUF4236 domain-containing protein [Fervidobacterium gondwanense]